MTMTLIMELYSDQVLTNPHLTTKEKIEKIKDAFKESSELRYDEPTGRYYEKSLDGFFDEESRKAYLERTQGLAVNLGGRCGWTLLGVAAEKGELGIIQWLIEEQGANIHLGNDSHTPIFIATGAGQVEVLRYLISKGADINRAVACYSADGVTGDIHEGMTPLHIAIRFGQKQAITVLIEHNVVIDLCSLDNPIQYGCDLLLVINNLKKGIEHPKAAQMLGDSKWRDVSKIPSQQNIKIILQLLEAHHKYQSFIRNVLTTNTLKDCFSIFHSQNLPVIFSYLSENNKSLNQNSLNNSSQDPKGKNVKSDHEQSLTAVVPSEKNQKTSLEFMYLLKAKARVIHGMQKPKKIPTDCEMKILSFLFGDFERHEGVSLRIENILAPENLPNKRSDSVNAKTKKTASH